MMMRGLHTSAIWTAGLSALTGTGFVAAFLSSRNPQPYLLTVAAIAATIGLVSLLISVVMVDVLAGRQFKSEVHLAQAGLPGNESARGEAAHFQERLQVLNKRLDIDEPRLCSQYLIPCTCWSFCAVSPNRDSIPCGPLRPAQELRLVEGPVAEQNGLPIVCRTGKDNCPFRFASSAARTELADRS